MLKNNKCLYHDQTSVLKTDKGKPVFNQVSPFSEIKNQARWEIPTVESDPLVKKRLSEQISRAKAALQQKIIQEIQQIDQNIDMVSMRKEIHSKEIIAVVRQA